MAREDVDVIISSSRENFFYLTGVDPVCKTLNPYDAGCFAFMSRSEPDQIGVVMRLSESDQVFDMAPRPTWHHFFGTFFREAGASDALTDDEEVLRAFHNVSTTHGRWWEAVSRALDEVVPSDAIVAVDDEGLRQSDREKLRNCIHQERWKSGSEIFRQARAVKTDNEVDVLSRGAEIGLSAYADVADTLMNGESEAEIKGRFERLIVMHGAHPRLTMLRVGRNAVFGQGRQRPDILVDAKSIVWLDCDFTYQGYWIDVARSIIPSDDRYNRSRYEALIEGQQRAIDGIRPGMTGAQVFAMVMETVRNRGLPGYRRHHVGHGIGLEAYEHPILSPLSEDVIEVGNVLCVETPFYEFGTGGLHVEDLVVIGDVSNRALRTERTAPASLLRVTS